MTDKNEKRYSVYRLEENIISYFRNLKYLNKIALEKYETKIKS